MHDWLTYFRGGHEAFPPTQIAIKAAVAIAVGLLVGFEREWANKDIGVRTFALTSLLGLLASLESPSLSLLAGASVLLLIVFLNLHSLQETRKLEATTSVALIVVFVLGVIVGDGHLFTPIACAIVVTMLLSLKPQFHAFAGGLRAEEVRSAIMLGLLGFVVWPLLPNRYVDPWRVINPREVWVTVIVLASLGFVNYVLLRIYGSKGLYLTAVLGGLVNSTATVAEMLSTLPGAGLESASVPVVLLTSIAMFSRNLLILALFARSAVRFAAAPLLAMAFSAGLWVYIQHRKLHASKPRVPLSLGSPVSLKRVLRFAALFLVIQVASTLAQRIFGASGLRAASVLGGLVSSASMTAAVAYLVIQGKTLAAQAGVATVLASIASLLADLPIARKQIKNPPIMRELYLASTVQAVVGVFALFAQTKLF